MAKKSNKTAHVLSLLTTQEKKNTENEVSVAKAPPKPDAPPEIVESVQKKEMKFERKSTDSLSDIIRMELEKQFETSSQKHTAEYISVNIMEDLVREKSPEFVKKLGGCNCHRCINDVIAIALNMLPPKHIVTQKEFLLTKTSFYENEYSADLISALTKAYTIVKNSPRH